MYGAICSEPVGAQMLLGSVKLNERKGYIFGEILQPDPYTEILSAGKKLILAEQENKFMDLISSNMMSNNETPSLSSQSVLQTRSPTVRIFGLKLLEPLAGDWVGTQVSHLFPLSPARLVAWGLELQVKVAAWALCDLDLGLQALPVWGFPASFRINPDPGVTAEGC